MDKFVNLTNEKINVILSDGSIQVLDASPNPVKLLYSSVSSIYDEAELVTKTMSSIEGLPDPVVGLWYIVPAQILWVNRNRTDLVSPSRFLDTSTGNIVVRQFITHVYPSN